MRGHLCWGRVVARDDYYSGPRPLDPGDYLRIDHLDSGTLSLKVPVFTGRVGCFEVKIYEVILAGMALYDGQLLVESWGQAFVFHTDQASQSQIHRVLCQGQCSEPIPIGKPGKRRPSGEPPHQYEVTLGAASKNLAGFIQEVAQQSSRPLGSVIFCGFGEGTRFQGLDTCALRIGVHYCVGKVVAP